MAGLDQEAALAELRRDIDRIDQTMHGLLMERGRIIDRLIAVKGGTAATGSAFRPEREASMMRILAASHAGGLPFDAVEGIWRIIISTFTHLQAPFAVHVDGSGDASAARDSARFHFGFIVPLDERADAGAVIEAVAASRGDLGLVSVAEAAASAAPWWQALEGEERPKVIAHLPFVERERHPAAYPMLVVATAISGEGLGAVVLHSVRGIAEGADADAGIAILARSADDALVAAPRGLTEEAVARSLGAASAAIVGSHPSTSPSGA